LDRLSKTIRRANTHLQKRDRLILRILSSKNRVARDFAAIRYLYNELTFNKLLSQKWLTELFETDLSSLSKTEHHHVKRLHHHYMHHGILSSKEILDTTLAISRCEGIWQQAKKEGNTFQALNELDLLLNKQREQNVYKMRHFGFNSAYEAAMNAYDPGISIDQLEALINQISPHCGFYDHPQEQKPVDTNLFSLDVEIQKKLCTKLLQHLAVDLDKTTFVEGPHPACFGQKGDVLITMDYDEKNFLYAVISTIHEGGHALLRQNAPSELLNGPAAEINSQATDETFALLFENTFSKSKGLARFIIHTLDDMGVKPAHLSEEIIYDHLNQSGFSLIRTKAESSNYSPHIILRYHIARQLMDHQMSATKIPNLWHEYEQTLFANQIERDDRRVLQDIHWYGGRIGYFPCYLTGMLASTQIYHHLCDENPDLINSINAFEPHELIRALKQGVFEQAYYKQNNDFIKQVTGKRLSAEAFIQNYKHAKKEKEKKICSKQGLFRKRKLF